MQKKVTQNKSKKAPKKGASNVAKKESIFNYDKYIDTNEAPKIKK